MRHAARLGPRALAAASGRQGAHPLAPLVPLAAVDAGAAAEGRTGAPPLWQRRALAAGPVFGRTFSERKLLG